MNDLILSIKNSLKKLKDILDDKNNLFLQALNSTEKEEFEK